LLHLGALRNGEGRVHPLANMLVMATMNDQAERAGDHQFQKGEPRCELVMRIFMVFID